MVASEQERFHSRSELLSPSLPGDLARVDRLVVGDSTRPGWTTFESLVEWDDWDPIAVRLVDAPKIAAGTSFTIIKLVSCRAPVLGSTNSVFHLHSGFSLHLS